MEAAQPACTRCGYSLAGLATDGNCPECGFSVAESLRGDFLRFADPVFAHRIDRGAAMLSVSLGLGVLLIFSLIASSFGGGICLLPAAALVLAAPILGTIGWCFFTADDPLRAQRGHERAIANTSRAAIAGAGLLVIVGITLRSPNLAFSAVALLPVFYTAALLHLRTIARRCRDGNPKDLATGVLRFWVFGVIATAVLIPLHMLNTGTDNPLMLALFIIRLFLYVGLGFAVLISPMLIAVCLTEIRKELDPVVRPGAQAAFPPAAE